MNSEVETAISILINDLPYDEREQARGILSECNFSDKTDPMLGILRYLQIRQKCMAETERPLAASVSRLAEEMDNRLWQARRIKVTFFVACNLLAFFFGGLLIGGLFFHMARVNPTGTMKYLGLTDPLIAQIRDAGVELRVQDNPENPAECLIGLTGKFVTNWTTSGNEHVLKFTKQP